MVPRHKRKPKRSKPDMRSANVTLASVAATAGVGESTVSRVLRNHGSFSEKTRDRVVAAATKLGYVPNFIAGTLASAGSRVAGIVVPSTTSTVFPDLLKGASAVLEETGYQSVITVTDYDLEREERLIGSILAWRPAAVLIVGRERSERTRAMLAGCSARVAELLDIDGPKALDIVVGYSHLKAGNISAHHLVSRGYRRIGYVGHGLGRDPARRQTAQRI